MKYQLPEEGIVILIDKPYGWTSFQLVNKTRWILKNLTGIKRVKVGHAGTLDPLATGLMVLCAGKKTKSIDAMLASEKKYEASFRFGYWSTSYDLEKKVEITEENPPLDSAKLETCRNAFLGNIQQMPPVFSAKKVKGKKAYEAARAGEKIELKSVPVAINQLELDSNRWPTVNAKISCSKGTYIRSLAHDMGAMYGSKAILSALRRTQSGDFLLKDAVTLPNLKAHLISRMQHDIG